MKNFYLKVQSLTILLAISTKALSFTDEYQVYNANIAKIGKYGLTLHNNFTPDGLKEPDFPDAIISDHALIGVPEWVYGVTDWFEQGLYLPLYSYSKNHKATLNGFKLRELLVRPNAQQHKFFYGMNFEFSVNAKQWAPRPITSEFRSIIGWHLSNWDIILNPIVDTDYTGGFANLQFVPAERLAYKINSKWSLAVEEYADYGPLGRILPASQQSHLLFGVGNFTSNVINIEAGLGFGLTKASDKLIIKLMLTWNLN